MIIVSNGYPLNDVPPIKKRHTYTERESGTITNIDFPVSEIGGGFKVVQPVGSTEFFTYGVSPGTLSTDDIDFGGLTFRNVLSRSTPDGDYYYLYRGDEWISVIPEAFGKYSIGLSVTDVIAVISGGVLSFKARGVVLGYSYRRSPGGETYSGRMSYGADTPLVTQTHRQYLPREVVTETETIITQS